MKKTGLLHWGVYWILGIIAARKLLFYLFDHQPCPVQDEAGLRHFIARAVNTYYHPVGSCKMGIDEMAVVDPELKVHGLSGLRVADASIMPRMVCVNTNPAAIMIGEKAAALIRGK